MKLKYPPLIFIIFFIITLVSFGTTPDIVFEKHYTSSLGMTDFVNLFNIDGKLLLLYHYNNDTMEKKPLNPGILLTDYYGNLINSLTFPSSDGFIIDNIKLSDNKYHFICSELDNLMKGGNRLFMLASGLYGEEPVFVIDTNNPKYQAGRTTIFEDSIFYGTTYYKDLTIDVYNDSVKYIRRILLDTNGLGYTYFTVKPGVLATGDNCFLTYIFGLINSEIKYSIAAKFNKEGKILWRVKLHIDDTVRTIASRMVETPEGDYLISGYMNEEVNTSLFIYKISHSGEILWLKKYNSGNFIYIQEYMKSASNGKYYLTYGFSSDDSKNKVKNLWLQIFDEEGNELDRYDWKASSNSRIYGVEEKGDGNLFVFGRFGVDSLYLAEIRPKYKSGLDDKAKSEVEFLSISPNPANDYLNIRAIGDVAGYFGIECSIVGSLGEPLCCFTIPESGVFKLNTSEFPQGVYFLKFRKKVAGKSGNKTYFQKFLIIK